MDGKSITKSKVSEGNYNDNELYARLRRLKIQEEILTTAASKSFRKCNADDIESSRYAEVQDLKKYINKIKKEYGDIRNLFEDIKAMTKDQVHLKNTDIDEIKRDIFDLDEKIKTLKYFINKETCILKVAEKEIQTQIRENEYKKHNIVTRAHSKPHYNEVVPSPVRAIINSPFKCAVCMQCFQYEVQRFQEFMKNSCNRYGGWDEYNHNIFAGIWNKHFKSEDILQNASIYEETVYISFQDEVMNKIFGIKTEDVRSHAEWYFEYTKLKKCQEVALNKWRENKRKIKKPKQIAKENDTHIKEETKISLSKIHKCIGNGPKLYNKKSDTEELFKEFNLKDDTEVLDVKFIIDNEKYGFKRNCLSKREEDNSMLSKTSKCNGFQAHNESPSGYSTNMFIDSVKKLKTPTWRIDLK